MIRKGWMLVISIAMLLSACGNLEVAQPNASPSQAPQTSSQAPVSVLEIVEEAIGNKQPPKTSAPTSDKQPEPSPTPAPSKENSDAASVDRNTGTLEVHFIDVGQGDSQLVIYYPSDLAKKKTMLIDAGDNDDEKSVVNYLKKQKIDTVDILIGTHPHSDHIGGLDAVINAFDIGKVYMPAVAHNTKTFEDVLDAVANKGMKITTAKSGVELDLHEHLTATMLAPVNDYEDLNNMSAVVHLAFGDTSFLFTGDAEEESERDMLNNKLLKHADVLAAGHHGSNTSSSQKFLDVVKPEYVVIQSGKDNSYGHPHREPLQRFEKRGATVYRNDLSGHIIAKSDGSTIEFRTTTATNSKNTPEAAQNTEPAQQDKGITSLAVNASIDKPEPSQNETVTVTVTLIDQNNNPVPDAQIKLVAKYKSKDTEYTATTDAKGLASIPFRIGRAAIGYEVKVNITATKDNITGKTSTSFTPK
ncbi:MBL fold metallo-hydrolase [Paenibacillus sp. GXUN7292]|uniref:MBL fold metallo-hydrolase n=1 Tax=Paenibacillus sp. GXUN7292 TaxID=3422499 RepID=UPI003D7DA8ED